MSTDDFTPAELQALGTFYDGKSLRALDAKQMDERGIAVTLQIIMEASAMQRAYLLRADTLKTGTKGDHSDVTEADIEIERFVRESLEREFPESGFDGEESGRTLQDGKPYNALDPVDGTTSMLHMEGRSGITFAHVSGTEVPLGIVAHPATGEIAYAAGAEATRLIQLGLRRAETRARTLPAQRNHTDAHGVLLQIGRHTNILRERLLAAWRNGTIARFASLQGSPAVGLLESAKGKKTLALQWLGGRETQPYDLAAGMKLVRNAGGRIFQMQEMEDGGARATGEIADDSLAAPIPNRGIVIASASADWAAIIQDIMGNTLEKKG